MPDLEHLYDIEQEKPNRRNYIFKEGQNNYHDFYVPPADYKPVVKIKYPRVLCGIEIEVENVGVPPEFLVSLKQKDVWMVKRDGSLRNNGFEYIFQKPLHGDHLSYSIENFFNKLPEHAIFSRRTSIHVHLDVRHWTYEHLYKLAMTYMPFEKLLYVLAGGHRYNNIFCVPLSETYYPSELSEKEILVDNDPLWDKYSGLNLGRVHDLGTIEFRQLEGNRDTVRILNWINVLMHIHQYAERTSTKELREILVDLNSTSMYQVFLNKVFGEDEMLFLQYDLQKLMEHGVTNAKMVRHKHEFSLKLKKELSLNSDLGRAFALDREMLRRT